MSQIFSPNSYKRLIGASVANLKRDVRNSNSYENDDDESSGSNNYNGPGSKQLPAEVMKLSKWKINTSIESKRADLSKICSICLSDLPDEPLVTPCLCTGLRAHQHKRCIEDWIAQTGATGCPHCQVRYEFSKRQPASFWAYMRDCRLEQEFVLSLAALAASIYLFLIGLSVCYHYILAVLGGHELAGVAAVELPLTLDLLRRVKGQFGLEFDEEQLVEGHLVARQARYKHSWLSTSLFCFVCTATVLLLIGIVSLSLNMMFRHYVRYWLWTKTHHTIDIKPYNLAGSRAGGGATSGSESDNNNNNNMNNNNSGSTLIGRRQDTS